LIHELVTSNRHGLLCSHTHALPASRVCVAVEDNSSSIFSISRVNFNTTTPTAMTRLTLPRLVLITAAGTLLACGGLAQAQGKHPPAIITPFPLSLSFSSLSHSHSAEWNGMLLNNISAAPPQLTRYVL
jgi:hypothetical protein